jgi:hypothetical protein
MLLGPVTVPEAERTGGQGRGLGLVALEQVYLQREPGAGGEQADGDLWVDPSFLAHPDLAQAVFQSISKCSAVTS